MNESPSLNTVAARWSWLRAMAFGLVAASIGDFGHAFAMGTHPSVLVFVIATVALTAYARLFVDSRIGRGAILSAVTVAQLLVHATMHLATPTTMQHGDPASMANVASMQGGAPFTLMLLVHVAAILLGAALLLRIEQLAWAQLVDVVAALFDFAVRLVRAIQRTVRCLLEMAVMPTTDGRSAFQLWLCAQIGRRGPPTRPLLA